jgi:hypothetical protein
MKKILIIAILISTLFSSCKKDNQNSQNNDIASQINAFPKEPLNSDEVMSLKWMREEEKLA